jgi:DNA-binding MurR/RpiR family transcriptional regulator
LPFYVAGIYPLRNLLSASHQMSESALKVAQYIMQNPESVASMSIGELAAATGSNKAAVVRVSKLSGYEGYRGLRAALIENKGVMRAADLIAFDLPSGAHKSDQSLGFAREVVKENIEVLQDTLTLSDEESLLDAVNAICYFEREARLLDWLRHCRTVGSRRLSTLLKAPGSLVHLLRCSDFG